MHARGCLIAAGTGLAVVVGVSAVFLPSAVRNGRRVVKPILEMRGTGREFRDFQAAHPWKRPAAPSLSAEQLDRFFTVRRELAEIQGRAEGTLGGIRGGGRPTLSDMPDLMEGVSDMASAEMKAYMRGPLTPAEYRYVERLVYRSWWGGLRKAGTDPAAWRRAAGEIEARADSERGAVGARLRQIAAELHARRPAPPPGVPPEVHDLLLARLADIEALAETGGRVRVGEPW